MANERKAIRSKARISNPLVYEVEKQALYLQVSNLALAMRTPQMPHMRPMNGIVF
jgi:hypothetical protein